MDKIKYVAFLRGINVGGHHKVPMAELKMEMGQMKFDNVVTLLNSGNILFDGNTETLANIEKRISERLEKTFGFAVPTLVRNVDLIYDLLNEDPFKEVEVTKDIRLYVSFIRTDTVSHPQLPYTSEDGSFSIIKIIDKTIISVLDLSIAGTPQAMEVIERFYGKDITTRNWNTIKRIEKKLESVR